VAILCSDQDGNSISNFTSNSSSHASGCPAIDNCIKRTAADRRPKWIDITDFTAIVSSPKSINGQTVVHVKRANRELTHMLLLLGSAEKCTPEYISEVARVYSLLTKYADIRTTIVSHFRRYPIWLESIREIEGFTKYHDNYYLVAGDRFCDSYYLYGFCSACGLLRCSPVWCICGHKEVSNGWTSNNKKLDEFIKKSQLQTKSANDAYLEWIPFDCVYNDGRHIDTCIPTIFSHIKLIPRMKRIMIR